MFVAIQAKWDDRAEALKMEGNRVRVWGRRVDKGVAVGEGVTKYEVKVSGIRTHGVCLCDGI